MVERPKKYIVDAEIGRLCVDLFEIKRGSKKVFSSGKDILPETGSREHYKTRCFRELVVFFPCDETFRKSAAKINRMLWREGKEKAVQFRTIANTVEREGALMQERLCQKAEDIVISNGFSATGARLDETQDFSGNVEESTLPQETIFSMIEELNRENGKERQIILSELDELFEDPLLVKANISLDDVCCKKQKASGRKKGSVPKEKREMVNNTVAHIQNGASQTYTVNTSNVSQMMMVVLAFLFQNGLMSHPGPLVFFLDGATDLRGAIEKHFGFLPFKILLDWYHLEKKCKERLSMAMKGKEVRNKALKEVLALLWLGKVEMAIQYLRSLNKDTLKSVDQVERLITYFSRNKSSIPCYALRKKLGLRVSSNPVEKANDLLVSNRQKQNGMSWSASGSTSLATVTCVRLNNEQMHWLSHHEIRFQFDIGAEKVAA